jgi:hypothetical protein
MREVSAMKLRAKIGAIGLGLALVLGSGSAGLVAQEPARTAPKSSSARRVPPYFGQVGITPQQREAIYTIRAKYAERLVQLKQEMAGLQTKEMAECEAVLNDQQRAALAEKRAASGRNRAAASAPKAENSGID